MVVDINTVKCGVISVVNMNPNGLPADKLNIEYESNMCSKIPYKALGYQSLLKFIEAEFKDKIRIEENDLLNEVLLFPIVTEKSAHIIKLVKEQKQNDDNNIDKQQEIQTAMKLNLKEEVSRTTKEISRYLHGHNRNWNDEKYKESRKAAADELIKNFSKFCASETESPQENVHKLVKIPNEKSVQTSKPPKLSAPRNDVETPPGMQCSNESKRMVGKCGKIEQAKNRNKMYQNGQMTETLKDMDETSKSSSIEVNYSDIWSDVLDDVSGVASSADDKIDGANTISKPVEKIKFSMKKEDAVDLSYAWTDLKFGERYECQLVEINNPNKFWIRLKNHDAYFKDLLKKMTEFYNRYYSELELWDDDLDEHELFACNYLNRWYRVRSEEKLKSGNVMVRFIDFGTRILVNRDKLRRLPSEFMKPPVFAICCALSNIRPASGDKFSVESAEHFFNVADKKDLILTVTRINKIKKKVYVQLKIKESGMDVTESIVQNGHASFLDDF